MLCASQISLVMSSTEIFWGEGGLGLGEDERKHKEKCLSTPDRLLCDESFLDENISYIENLRRARMTTKIGVKK